MITFVIAIAVLILGYVVYGRFVERIFGINGKRKTPAVTMTDGVDYVPMKPWRIFLIQFLNIAGIGPICGAIMGAQFGSSSFLWIVFGSIFAGAVHDFMSGMISVREKGCNLPDIHGKYLGRDMMRFMSGFIVLIVILVGVVFVNTPVTLLDSHFTPGDNNIFRSIIPDTTHLLHINVDWDIYIWMTIILVYYFIATMLPIDKLIGKIYPVFGLLLLVMAGALIVAFIVYKPAIPEVWEGLENRHPQAAQNPIFPMMFISIACGAISGFHATQSPIMARCIISERQGRPIFYGAMITEGVVALVWAAAAAYFYHDPVLSAASAGKSGPGMVGFIADTWFTDFSKTLTTITILGVISAAITSGDTALRSARLMIADFLHLSQKPIKNRLIIAVPLFAIVIIGIVFSIVNKNGFRIVWNYFSWANQFLAMVTLWAITFYLVVNTKKFQYWLTLVPATFMTMVTISFIFVSPSEGLGTILPRPVGYGIAGFLTIVCLTMFFHWKNKLRKMAA